MISVVQDIICSSKNDRQQTIEALFDVFPNTKLIELKRGHLSEGCVTFLIANKDKDKGILGCYGANYITGGIMAIPLILHI